jgi:hypothetical protein
MEKSSFKKNQAGISSLHRPQKPARIEIDKNKKGVSLRLPSTHVTKNLLKYLLYQVSKQAIPFISRTSSKVQPVLIYNRGNRRKCNFP